MIQFSYTDEKLVVAESNVLSTGSLAIYPAGSGHTWRMAAKPCPACCLAYNHSILEQSHVANNSKEGRQSIYLNVLLPMDRAVNKCDLQW